MRRMLSLMRQMIGWWLLAVVSLVALTGCNLRQGNATNTPYPTPDIPQVDFIFPENNSTVLEGTDLQIDVVAEDPGDGVARVELFVDDVLLREAKPEVSEAVPTFTVRFNWLAQGVGIHSLTVVAYRMNGAASSPTTILVQVLPRAVTSP